MMNRLYAIFHLTVSSPFELDGFQPLRGGSPEVFIRRGHVPPRLQGAGQIWNRCQLKGEEFQLTVPGAARYLVRNGREIIVDAGPGAPAGTLQLFLLGSAFGALLHQREELVLHGSSVAAPDGAVLLLGRTGQGKSTLAALLGRERRCFLGDDKAVILRRDGRLLLCAGPQQSWLCRDVIERMGIREEELGSKRTDRDKFAWQAPFPISNLPAPLYRIYELLFHERPEPVIVHLHGPHAARALMRNVFRRGIRRRMAGVERCFQQCAELALQVPVRQLRRNKTRHSIEQVLALLRADLALPSADPQPRISPNFRETTLP